MSGARALGVVGGGAFGTALALAADGPVTIWVRQGAAAMDATRESPRLPGLMLPPRICVTEDPRDLHGCDALLFAVPMQALGAVLAAHDFGPAPGVACCKGIDLATLEGPGHLLGDLRPTHPPALLTGPGFAADLGRGRPTAMVLACPDEALGASLQARLAHGALRLYRTDDLTGAELGGALKNVVALACGASDGAGFGESARAALLTRGFAEMRRLAAALGARAETLMGLSGLGDLVLTATSPQSRNFRAGLALGRGEALPGGTVEGVATAEAALRVAAGVGVTLPVTEAVAALVAGRIDAKGAMRRLMERPMGVE